MMNLMEIDGYRAVIQYDPDIDMFRGEFVNLKGGADFYAKDIEQLKKEGQLSLQLYLDACLRRGIEPHKNYSGKFNLRIPVDLHAKIVSVATASNKSLNQWITDTLKQAV